MFDNFGLNGICSLSSDFLIFFFLALLHVHLTRMNRIQVLYLHHNVLEILEIMPEAWYLYNAIGIGNTVI